MSEAHDVVVIGGGVTGLSACIYTLRNGLSTLLIEGTGLGGQIINADAIENFPGFPQGIMGSDLVAALQEQALNLGLEFAMGQVTGLDVSSRPMAVRTEGGQFPARSVIITTGGERNRLEVPGEEAFEGRGVSTCATCDGYFFADRDVAVIGGGDTALDEALYLTQVCSSVTLVHRRDRLSASQDPPGTRPAEPQAGHPLRNDGRVNLRRRGGPWRGHPRFRHGPGARAAACRRLRLRWISPQHRRVSGHNTHGRRRPHQG